MTGEVRRAALRGLDLASLAAFAARLAEVLREGDVVRLEGGLGAGKTTLARALIRSRAGAPVEVPSPTFTLVQDYELPGLTVRHVDLYRIEAPDELADLGLEEVEAGTALVVEWPEHGGDRLPPGGLLIRIEPGADEGRRDLELGAGRDWADRFERLVHG